MMMFFGRRKASRQQSYLNYQQNKLDSLLDPEGRIDTDKLLADSNFSLGGMSVFLTSLSGSLKFGLTPQFETFVSNGHTLSFNGYSLFGSRFAKVAVEVMFKRCKSDNNSPAELRLTDSGQLKALQSDPLITFVVYDETDWIQSQMRDLFMRKGEPFYKPMIVFLLKKPIEFTLSDSWTQVPFGFGRFCKVDSLSLDYGIRIGTEI